MQSRESREGGDDPNNDDPNGDDPNGDDPDGDDRQECDRGDSPRALATCVSVERSRFGQSSPR